MPAVEHRVNAASAWAAGVEENGSEVGVCCVDRGGGGWETDDWEGDKGWVAGVEVVEREGDACTVVDIVAWVPCDLGCGGWDGRPGESRVGDA